MLLVMISLLGGIAAAACVTQVLEAGLRLRLEKSITERLNGTRSVSSRGLSENMLFAAGKIGTPVLRIRNRHLDRLRKNIETSLSVLGDSWRNMNQATFAGIQILSGIACVPCTAVLFNAFDPLLAALSFAGGILLPYAYLKAKVREKRTGIFRQIPDVLDLLALMMEAGIDFNTAMRRIIASDRGPLISELALVQRQIELGKSRADSYASLAERIDFMPLTNVVNAFLLSFSSGASLAPALTTLSEQFRVERMQLAEKSANETPVKLLLPLVTLIFPTIFIILFGPLLLSFLGEGF